MTQSDNPPNQRRKNLRRAVLAVSFVLAVVTCYLTLLTKPDLSGQQQFDKLYHFLAFAALVLPSALFDRRDMLWIAVSALALGAIIEVIQPSFGRSADMQDWIADIAGVALGIALALLYRRLRRHRA